jgi:hypothetical protein
MSYHAPMDKVIVFTLWCILLLWLIYAIIAGVIRLLL